MISEFMEIMIMDTLGLLKLIEMYVYISISN